MNSSTWPLLNFISFLLLHPAIYVSFVPQAKYPSCGGKKIVSFCVSPLIIPTNSENLPCQMLFLKPFISKGKLGWDQSRLPLTYAWDRWTTLQNWSWFTWAQRRSDYWMGGVTTHVHYTAKQLVGIEPKVVRFVRCVKNRRERGKS